MRRQKERLLAKQVEKFKTSGYHPDGGGLHLQVSASGSKSWIYKYTLQGRTREMGLGSYPAISLADARKKAAEQRALLADGADPIEARNARKQQEAVEAAQAKTFRACCEAYIEGAKAGWKNRKHEGQWRATLKTYAYPIIGGELVENVNLASLMRVLSPIWATKPETASRLRGRIEAVLDWAAVHGYRTGENPARWRGNLSKAGLPAVSKAATVKHHPALPYEEMGEFMKELRQIDTTTARAMELLVLTSARTGEIIEALPSEFDLDKALWIIPASRMKAGREHRVPLCPAAVKIVQKQMKLNGVYLFPGMKANSHISNMAMLVQLRRMGYGKYTMHGFRSAFRDWGAEQTAYPSEVLEAALAHQIKDATVAAYKRTDFFDKRRRLALDWAKHCDQGKKAGEVTPIRKTG